MFNFFRNNQKKSKNPFDLMMIAFKKGLFIEALEWGEKALESKSKFYSDGDVYTYMAECYKSYGNSFKVIENYEKAVKSNPNNADFHRNLGVAYRESGKIQEALAEYEKALEIQPNEVLTITSLAILHLFLGNFDESEKLFLEAIEKKGDGTARAYGNYALLLAMKKDFKKARAMLENAHIFGYENTDYVKNRINTLEKEIQENK